MKVFRIPLQNSKRVAIADMEFRPILLRHKWYLICPSRGENGTCYCYTTLSKRLIRMHTFLIGYTGGKSIDHIDRDGLNNSLSNLRLVCHSHQNQNRRLLFRNNQSGYKGVYFNKRAKHFYAKINKKRKQRFLGQFKNPKKAAEAYDIAAYELYGEHATLNFPRRAKRYAREVLDRTKEWVE